MVAAETTGQWRFEKLQFNVAGSNEWVDLLQSAVPASAPMNPISLTSVTPQSGWAVGNYGIIVHTEDGGTTWKPQTSGTIENSLLSVAFATQESGWVVGENGIILHTGDGRTWKPQTSGTWDNLWSVAFATPQSGWAVGWDGTVLRTGDGGGSWKTQTGGTGEGLFSVAFATPQSGWVAGGRGHNPAHRRRRRQLEDSERGHRRRPLLCGLCHATVRMGGGYRRHHPAH